MKSRRFLFKFYTPTSIFWIARLNLTVFTDMRCIEFTLGLFGFGILTQLYFGKQRMK